MTEFARILPPGQYCAQLKAAAKATPKAPVAPAEKATKLTKDEHRARGGDLVANMAPYPGDDEGPAESGGQMRLRM